MKRPPSLQQHDKAVILSPAGKVEKTLVFNAAVVLESWGLHVVTGEHALQEVGRFSGTVEQRLKDLQHAFDDPEVKLIFCSRGGYGVVHLLNRLDFRGIKSNPKWVVGYSDITALHAALQAHDIASVHGPMAKHFSEEGGDDPSVRYTKSILMGEPLLYEIPLDDSKGLNRNGVASGTIFGGNLAVLCSLLGTPYFQIPHKGILFIEDIGETPYRVDRMIWQLKHAGVFDQISGLIVGQFTDYEEDNQMYLPLHQSIIEVVRDDDFPVCFNFPVGHTRLNYPILMGMEASLHINTNNILFKQ